MLQTELNRLFEIPAKILLVDDDETIAALVRTIMRRAGVEVMWARDGESALHMLRRHRVDLVLLDHSLPDLPGHEVVPLLRNQAGMMDVPMVAVTGHDDEEVHRTMRHAGCVDVVVKPVDQRRLMALIEQHIVRYRYEPPIHVTVEADIADLLPGYLERRRADIASLLSWLENSDFARIKSLGHQLKGSGSAYGLETISEQGQLLEQAARKSDKAAASTAIATLEKYLLRLVIAPSNPKESDKIGPSGQ